MSNTMSEHTPPEPVPTFEESLAELQAIVAELEDGALGLEPSLARFEQGIGLLRQCYATLEQAEQKIETLVRIDPAGQVVTAPFDAAATYAPSEPAPRKAGRRRSAAGPAAEEKAPAESTPASGGEEMPPPPPAAYSGPSGAASPPPPPPCDEEPPFDVPPPSGKRLF